MIISAKFIDNFHLARIGPHLARIRGTVFLVVYQWFNPCGPHGPQNFVLPCVSAHSAQAHQRERTCVYDTDLFGPIGHDSLSAWKHTIFGGPYMRATFGPIRATHSSLYFGNSRHRLTNFDPCGYRLSNVAIEQRRAVADGSHNFRTNPSRRTGPITPRGFSRLVATFFPPQLGPDRC